MGQDFAQRFAGLRHKAGLSQRKAAAELNISQALLSHYENGLREPKLEFIVKVCEYYGVTVDYLLGRTEGCSETVAALMDIVPDIINQIGERYGKPAAENAAYYVSLALYKFAVCTDRAEAEKCAAAMAMLESEMLEQRGDGEYNKRWFEREHPNRYAQIKDKINSVKHGDLK